MIILSDDIVESSTVSTANDTLPDLDVQQARRLPVGRPWRVLGTSCTLDFDSGAGNTFKVFAAISTNLTSAATIRVALSNTAAGNNDVYDSGTVNANATKELPNAFHILSSEVTARYGSVTFVDTSREFIDIGRVVGGPAWLPTETADFDQQISVNDASVKLKSITGETLVSFRGKTRRLEFQLSYNTEAEMVSNAFEIDRAKGLTLPILVIADAENELQKLSLYGMIDRSTPLNHWVYQLVRKRYIVSELKLRPPIEGGPIFVPEAAQLRLTGYAPTVVVT